MKCDQVISEQSALPTLCIHIIYAFCLKVIATDDVTVCWSSVDTGIGGFGMLSLFK